MGAYRLLFLFVMRDDPVGVPHRCSSSSRALMSRRFESGGVGATRPTTSKNRHYCSDKSSRLYVIMGS
jgi:hypothetical protein